MFHPAGNPMDRGWVGRIDGDRMVHLAAQTLQSLFLNGTTAREHAEYPLAEVTLLVPVQYPPTVRLFDDAAGAGFRFGNPTSVVGDGVPVVGSGLTAAARIAAVIGAGGAVGGWSALLEWEDPAEAPAVKRADFGLVLGPTVVTPDEAGPTTNALRISSESKAVEDDVAPFPWAEALTLAGRRTVLRPGDVIAGPPVVRLEGVDSGVELDAGLVGTLHCPLA